MVFQYSFFLTSLLSFETHSMANLYSHAQCSFYHGYSMVFEYFLSFLTSLLNFDTHSIPSTLFSFDGSNLYSSLYVYIEVAQLVCNELDRRFPQHALLDAFGIIYPQYWR